MPSGLSPGDRKLLAAGGLIGALMLLGTVVFAPAPGESGGMVPPSSYSSSASGALAAYTLLEELKIPVRRLEEPPSSLPDEAAGAVLVLAEPMLPPSKGERRRLMEFVRDGGRILFCGPELPRFFPGPQLAENESFSPEPGSYAPLFPSAVSRQAENVVMRRGSHWSRLLPSQLALYGPGSEEAVVVSWRLGAGEILWWSAATPLTNAGITRGDNLRFLLNSIGGAKSVWWDEYYHGQRGSLWDYVARTPLPWALAQAAVLAVLAWFAFGRRSGPVSMPLEVSRLSPLEFVDTMGGLYQRAGAAAVAVDTSYRQLRRKLSRRLGLPSTTGNEELAQAAAQRLSLPETDLRRTLQSAATAALNPQLSPKAALKLVDDLEYTTARMDQPPPGQENH